MTNKAQSIIGDGHNRIANDFYPTPPSAVEALLQRETFHSSVWEPACGTGNISRVLLAHKYNVFSTDLIDYGYGSIQDFLTSNIENIASPELCSGLTADTVGYDILTNPPFNLALEFILQAKKLANNKIALLLKTQFLEGTKRYEMFQDKTFPLKCMYRFSKRLTFNRKSGGMLAFAWFVWERDYLGKPYIDWIK